jgi:hypothetical protein
MSREAVARVIERASTDAAFRAQLGSNPESALAGYDLTPEERAAVLSGDSAALHALGVDPRISKLDNPPYPGEPTDWGNQPWTG